MFCPNCGKQIPDDSAFCPDCGATTGGAVDEFSPEEVKNGKAAAIWAYFIPILFFIPLASQKKKTAYGLRHANNALIILIIDAVVSAVREMLKRFLSGTVIANVIGIVLWLAGIATFALAIVGIVYACSGTKKELPVIGSLHILDK